MFRIFIAILIVVSACLNPLPLFAQDIAVYSDTQTNHDVHRKLIAAVLNKKPSIVFHAGDLVDNGLDPKQWAIFNSIASRLIRSVEFYPALGNHEYNSKLFFNNFVLPNNERWYCVEKGGIHFIVLDTNSDISRDSEQYRWLETDLHNISDTIKFVVAIFHHPPFSCCTSHPKDEKGLMDIVVPLFENYGVDIVFSGHCHNYERFLYQDTYYIVTGGGGGRLSHRARVSPYSQFFAMEHHFCILSMVDDQLMVSVFDLDLNLLDQIKINSKAQKRRGAREAMGIWR